MNRSHRPVTQFVPVFACLLFAAAGPARAQIAHPDSTPPERVVLSGPVEVPLVDSGIRGATLPVVEAMVNGRGPFRFGIETGAGFVAFSRALAESLGLPPRDTTREFDTHRIDSVRVGGAVFQGVTASVLDRSGTGVDGLFGLPFYRDLLLTIDYPRGRARFERDTLPPANGRDVLALRHVGPFWGLPVTFAGHAWTAVLDTRSTGSLSLAPSVAATLPFEGELTVVGRASGAAIPETEVKGGRLNGAVTIGAYSIRNPFVMVRSLPPGFPEGPLVGAVVLRNFAVSLDQRTARLRLARTGPTEIVLPEPRPQVVRVAGPDSTGQR
jgi:hypothetical protein